MLTSSLRAGGSRPNHTRAYRRCEPPQPFSRGVLATPRPTFPVATNPPCTPRCAEVNSAPVVFGHARARPSLFRGHDLVPPPNPPPAGSNPAPATMQIPRATRRRGPLLLGSVAAARCPTPCLGAWARNGPVRMAARTLTHCAAVAFWSGAERRDRGSRGCASGRRAWRRGSSRARAARSSSRTSGTASSTRGRAAA